MNTKTKKISCLVSSLLIILYTIITYQTAFASSISEDELGQLLNQERTARNLDSLNWNSKLYEACENKLDDMIKDNYFEHYAPDGTSPWYFINASGYDYKIAGENLAMDFSTSQAVNDAWMASSTHKENILNVNYEDYAICKKNGKIDNEDTTLIVEMFGKKDKLVIAKTNHFFTSILNFLLGKDEQIQ